MISNSPRSKRTRHVNWRARLDFNTEDLIFRVYTIIFHSPIH